MLKTVDRFRRKKWNVFLLTICIVCLFVLIFSSILVYKKLVPSTAFTPIINTISKDQIISSKNQNNNISFSSIEQNNPIASQSNVKYRGLVVRV